MKPPSEADLIELESALQDLKPNYQVVKFAGPEIYRQHRVWDTLEYLVARARFHNARQLQRTSTPEPAPSARPKAKKARK